MTAHDVDLFKKFQTWSETNAKEHTLSYMYFIVRMLLFSGFGLAIGHVGEKTIVNIQGPLDTSKVKCASYVALQIIILATVFFIFISFGRYFDDWLWNTFAGSFFALCLFNAQVRLNDNISCLLI